MPATPVIVNAPSVLLTVLPASTSNCLPAAAGPAPLASTIKAASATATGLDLRMLHPPHVVPRRRRGAGDPAQDSRAPPQLITSARAFAAFTAAFSDATS